MQKFVGMNPAHSCRSSQINNFSGQTKEKQEEIQETFLCGCLPK